MEVGAPTLNLALWVLLAVVLALTLVFGIALSYHLFRYSTNSSVARIATALYASVASVLALSLVALVTSL